MYGISVGGTLIAEFAAPLSVLSEQPIFATDTASLTRRVSRRAVQRWRIRANIIPLSTDANDLFVDLVVKDKHSDVDVVVPQNFGVISRRTANGALVATGSIGASQVTLSGVNGLIPKGTFIKFNNHSKIYITTGNISVNGVVGIFPELRAAVSATTVLYRDDVIMKCLYDFDTAIGMSYTDGILMDPGTISFVEKL